MASQSPHEARDTPLAPSTDGEPTAEDPPDSSLMQMWIQGKFWQSRVTNPRTHIWALKKTIHTGPERRNGQRGREQCCPRAALPQEALDDRGGCGLHLCALE